MKTYKKKINVEKSRWKLQKSIENEKLLQYYNYSKNLKKSKKETQNMEKAKTFAGVESATTLINNNKARKLALLSIVRTRY